MLTQKIKRNKPLLLVSAMFATTLLLLLGLILKNMFFASKLDDFALIYSENLIAQQVLIEDIEYKDVTCEGFISTTCFINETVFKINTTAGIKNITVESFEINDFLKSLKSFNQDKTLNVNVKALNINLDKYIKNNIILSGSPDLVKLLENELNNFQINVKFTNTEHKNLLELNIDSIKLNTQYLTIDFATKLSIAPEKQLQGVIVKEIKLYTHINDFSGFIYDGIYTNHVKEGNLVAIHDILEIDSSEKLNKKDFKERSKKGLKKFITNIGEEQTMLTVQQEKLNNLIDNNKGESSVKVININQTDIGTLINLYITSNMMNQGNPKTLQEIFSNYIKVEAK